jgi:hypothetical protein
MDEDYPFLPRKFLDVATGRVDRAASSQGSWKEPRMCVGAQRPENWSLRPRQDRMALIMRAKKIAGYIAGLFIIPFVPPAFDFKFGLPFDF